MGGFSADMGAQAIYVWPAYAAFVVIFGGLVLWVRRSGAREKARLETLEETKGRAK